MMQKKRLAWFPAIAIAAAIFYFSAQPADVSTEVSDGVGRLLFQIAEEVNIVKASPEALLRWCEIMSTPVRKTAHITEYALLHISVLFALYQQGERGTRWLKTAFALTVFYACTDEFHQLFVPGRAGMIRDVMIDSIGVLIITWILWKKKKDSATQER